MKQFVKIVGLLFGTCCFSIACKKDNVESDTISTNKPPVGNPGWKQSARLPADSTYHNGTSSTDYDGVISEWHWSQVSTLQP